MLLIKFVCSDERPEKWVAISIDPRRGLGLFVKGKVKAGEILATYRGIVKKFKKNQKIPKQFRSGYVFSFLEEDGTIFGSRVIIISVLEIIEVC